DLAVPRRRMRAPHRVVITGVGAVTAVVSGGADAVARAIAALIPTDAERVDRALAQLVDHGEARRLSRVSQLTLAAARIAIDDAGSEANGAPRIGSGPEPGDLLPPIGFA